MIDKSYSSRSSQCIRLNSDKPQTTVFFVFHQKVSKFGHFLIGRFPLNRQIFKLDHEWRILIKEELNLNIFHPPFVQPRLKSCISHLPSHHIHLRFTGLHLYQTLADLPITFLPILGLDPDTQFYTIV